MPRDSGERRYSDSEVVAIFADAPAIEAAIDALEMAGTDRACIAVMSTSDTLDAHFSHRFRRAADLADAAQGTGHGIEVTRYEMAEGAGALVSVPVYIGATAGLIAVFATGGGLLIALAAGLVGGTMGGSFGVMAARALGRHHAEHLEDQLRSGGLLLWVVATDPADETAKINLLRARGGSHVHAHHYDRPWGDDDVPGHAVQPDPLLDKDPEPA